MISVCIPVYQIDVSRLVEVVRNQLEKSDEIILIDDCSAEKIQANNRKLRGDQISYIQLEQNVGRAKIRNLFLKYAKNTQLLFLDCDSLVIQNDFIQRYKEAINKKNPVICGGRVYPKACPSKQQSLSWKYGIEVESKSVKKRKENPNQSFMTNNFLIERTVLKLISFDERLTQYGHEDTLFGIQLKKHNIFISHIENPVLNNDIELNTVFLNKTEKGIQNLSLIIQFYEDKNTFIQSVKLLKLHQKIKKCGLTFIVNILYKLFYNVLRKKLISSSNSSMKLFGFYKLMYFTNLVSSKSNTTEK